MIVINNLMKHLQDYELEGLKLRNKKTKEFKVFSNKEELFYEVYNIYIIYKTNLKTNLKWRRCLYVNTNKSK